MYGDILEYYFRLQFSAFWSMHDKTLSWENANFKMYPPPPPPKKWITSRKKLTPQPPPEKSRTSWQETQVTGNILIPWETLSFWKNISLPPHPPPSKTENLNLQENEKTSLLVKVSTTLKLPQLLWKSLKPPTWKVLNISKSPNSIGKIFNSFEVTRPIKPSPYEKISIPENLTPFRKLRIQSCYIHVKIEINLPENISPPPRNLPNPLNKLNTTEIIPTPPEKISNTSESISTPPKIFKPLPEKSQPHRKTPPLQK